MNERENIKAIYKITNKINGKIYIGQSNNPKERFKSHCRLNQSNKNSLIGRAIQKYGKDNFSFEIIGWFENYNEKEIEYIKLFNSLVPNGYNILEGGQEPPHIGQSRKITEEVANLIINDLLNWKICRKEIIKKYGITYNIIRHINEGHSWKRENLEYPLRPTEAQINEWKAIQIQNDLIYTTKTQKEIAKEYGWGRTAVTNINNGRTHFNENLSYPLRKSLREQKALLIKQIILNSNESFEDIAKNFNISTETIKKINSGQTYYDKNLSYPLRKN